MPSRRDAIKTAAVAVTGAAAWSQQHQHDQKDSSLVQVEKGPYEPKAFTATEFATLSRMVDLIIPRTETPGALDARVPALIDTSLSRNEPMQKTWKEGLAGLDAAARGQHQSAFAQLQEPQQIAVLTPMSEQPETPLGRFFTAVKGMTIDLYYSTPEGLKQELGWNANTYLPKWTGCTHPEHQIDSKK